jgi:hypothetical protein
MTGMAATHRLTSHTVTGRKPFDRARTVKYHRYRKILSSLSSSIHEATAKAKNQSNQAKDH